MGTTLDQPIADARKAHAIEWARFAMPLIVFLDTPPSERRVFDWLIPCVGDVLDLLGANTLELRESLAMAQRSLAQSDESEAIEARAWELWYHRVPGDAKTAVAQLLFALLAYRKLLGTARLSCATPLSILDRMASDQGGILEQVIANFSEYAGR